MSIGMLIVAALFVCAVDRYDTNNALERLSRATGKKYQRFEIIDCDGIGGYIDHGCVNLTKGVLDIAETEGEIASYIAHLMSHKQWLAPFNFTLETFYRNKELLMLTLLMAFLNLKGIAIGLCASLFLNQVVFPCFWLFAKWRSNLQLQKFTSGVGKIFFLYNGWVALIVAMAVNGVPLSATSHALLWYFPLQLSFGFWLREDEYTADSEGIRLMRKAGYNPLDMVRLLEKLQENTYESWILKFYYYSVPTARQRLGRIERLLTG